MRQRWSKQKICERICALHEGGVEVTYTEVYQIDRKLATAGLSYFGNWRSVLCACNLPYVRRSPANTKYHGIDDVIKAIQERSNSDLALNSAVVQRDDGGLFNAAYRLVDGGWDEALRLAGENPAAIRKSKPQRKWSPEKVIQAIRKLDAEGVALNAKNMETVDVGLYAAAGRHCGGWYPAVEMALGSSEPHKLRTSWSKKKVIEEIRSLAAQEEPLYSTHVEDHHNLLHQAARRYFGNWGTALEAALDLDYCQDVKRTEPVWSAQRVLAYIEDLDTNHEPLYSEYTKQHHNPFYQAAIYYFDSYRGAIEASGRDYESIIRLQHRWSPEKVLERIQVLKQSGEPLNVRYIRDNYSCLYYVARYYFDSWADAVFGAEIDYLAECDYWSTKAWLRSLGADVQ